jgi:hypothetical protein
MNHLSEEQLVWHYYGEAVDGAEEHLDSCRECREELRRLQMVLNAVSAAGEAERGPDYGAEVWSRLRLTGHPGRRSRFSWRWLSWRKPVILAPLLAGLVAAAFFVGQRYPARDQGPTPASAQANVRERILLVAVGDHLDRSQTVLAELSHASPEGAKFDISYEQKAAGDLLDANRLYRQTAQRTGDAAVADILDDLERVLVEIANGPATVTPEHLEALQRRIHDQGLLFKVRVMGTQVKQRERIHDAPENTKSL